MKKTFRWSTILLVFTVLLLTLAACNDDKPKENNTNQDKNNTEINTNNDADENNANNDNNVINEKTEANEPNNENNNSNNDEENVTVKVFFPWGEELFEERVGPMDERLEHIDIELVEHKEGSTVGLPGAIEAYAAEKIIPDIIVMGRYDITNDYLADIVHPLDELVEKHDFDLELLNPDIIKTIRATSTDDSLLAIPNSNDYVVLYYNKEVFDKFGIDYPTDDMSWREIIELSKLVTGEKDGNDYRGLDIRGAGDYALQQRSVNLTDPETGEVLITKEPAVKEWLELVDEIYSAHGNFPDPWEDGLADGLNDFINGKVGMVLAAPQFMRWGLTPEVADKMDFAAAPYWEDAPQEAAPAMSHYYWVINEFSENKDAAFEVLMEYMSEETQGQLTREGQEMTILANDSLKLEFGSELENFDGKNIGGIFAHEPTDPPTQKSKYDKYVIQELDIDAFLLSDDDTNTFLRKVEEEAETAIKEAANQ